MTEPYETDDPTEYEEWLESKSINYYTFTISNVFVSALEYDDCSALNKQDQIEFEAFKKELPNDISHFDYKDTENTNFTKCDICHLNSDCVTAFGIIRSNKDEDMVWWSAGSGLIELQMYFDDAEQCSHPGSCDADVQALSEKPYIIDQISKLDKTVIASDLSEYGAWSDTELQDHEQNVQRLIWIAAGDIAEGKL